MASAASAPPGGGDDGSDDGSNPTQWLRDLFDRQDALINKLTAMLEKQAEQHAETMVELKEARSKQEEFVKTFCAKHTELVDNIDKMVAQMIVDKTHTYDSMNITNPLTADITIGSRVGNQIFRDATTVPSVIEENKWTVESSNYDSILSFLNDQKNINGYDALFLVPTKGTGDLMQNPKKLSSGDEVANVDITDKLCMVNSSAKLETKHVLEYAGFIHGSVKSGRKASTDMEQKVLDFTSTNPNSLLVAKYKHQLRIRSEMLCILLNKCIARPSLDTFLLHQKKTLQYTKESDGTTFYDGLTLLWYILEALEPKSVIESAKYEKIIESTTLASCDMNVRAYISKVKGNYDELITRHGTGRMSDSKFTEIVFKALKEATNPSFSAAVLAKETSWLTDAKNFKLDEFFTSLESLYNALVLSNRWSEVSETDQKVIAMAADLKSVKQTNKQILKSAGGDGGEKQKPTGPFMKDDVEMAGPPGSPDGKIPKWRTVKKGDTMADPKSGALHQWCKEHRQKRGLYMICNSEDKKSHDHAKWLENRGQRKKKNGGTQQESSSPVEKKRKDGPTTLKVTAQTRKRAFVSKYVKQGIDHHMAESMWIDSQKQDVADSDEGSVQSK